MALLVKQTKRFLMTFGLVIILCGCATTQRDWQEANRRGTIEDYEQFLKTHPDAEQCSQARQRLEDLRADQVAKEWSKVKSINTINKYKHFLEKYPAAEQASQAEAKLEELKFERAVKSASEDDLQQFIDDYPDSDYATEARQLRIRIQDIQSKITANPAITSIKTGLQISEIIARFGKSASGGMIIESSRFSSNVVGKSFSWQLYPDNSRYFGILNVCTDMEGKVTSFNTDIGIHPSAVELAAQEQKERELAERRRTSNKMICVTIFNQMATDAKVSINGERISEPLALDISATKVPGSNLLNVCGQSGQIEFLPGDYSLSLNGKSKSIVIPDRTYSTRNGNPTFYVYIENDGSIRTDSYPND